MTKAVYSDGARVALPPSRGAYIGTVAEVDTDNRRYRIKWNGGDLVAGAVGEWVGFDDVFLFGR